MGLNMSFWVRRLRRLKSFVTAVFTRVELKFLKVINSRYSSLRIYLAPLVSDQFLSAKASKTDKRINITNFYAILT
jgi:hypothetical protein